MKVLALTVWAVTAASTAYEAALKKAEALYNEAEWDAALGQLSTAEQAAASDEERVLVWLHQGVMWANMPNSTKAQAVWTRALQVAPKAELPLAVSPRVRALFQQTQNALKPRAAPVEAATAPPPKAGTPGRTPARNLIAETEEPKLPLVPVICLGSALVVSGVGVGLMVSANSHFAAARSAPTNADADALRQRGQLLSTLAGVTFAVAGAAALTALITFLLMN